MTVDEKRVRESVGKFLKQARKAHGLKQEDVANRLGLTRSSVANIETGRQKLSLTMLLELMLMFRISKIERRVLLGRDYL